MRVGIDLVMMELLQWIGLARLVVVVVVIW